MSNASPDPKRWSAYLLLAAAFFPPLATFLATTQGITVHGITDKPWVMVIIFFIYEILLFAAGVAGEIWQKLKGSWIDQISLVIDHAVRRLVAGYDQHYRTYLRYEHRDIDVQGLSTQGTYTLDLDQVFVELRIDSKPAHQASGNPLRVPDALSEGSHTIWTYLAAQELLNEHLVILGPPGSGKTTLIKHLALNLLSHKATRRKKLPYKLPILLFLRDHSTNIKEKEYSLADAVRLHTAKWKRTMPPGWIERYLDQGHCLVLLDGLDEVADPEVREKVVLWVKEQMIAYSKNRFVVTSRPFGYLSNPLTKVMLLEVQSFTVEQIKQFVHRWYLTNEIKSAVRNDPGVHMQAETKAADLLRRLHKAQGLMDLAVNPLLLTMIATVHRYRGSLPGTRVLLYKEICEVFLGKRQEARGLKQELRADQRQLVLQALAYQMMIDGVREISRTRAQEIIKEPLRQVSTEITPAAFLHSIENISGLLLERENSIYIFAHLTFQEYLAVTHIRENHREDLLVTQVGVSWWHEAIKLYCAQADATRLLQACLKDAGSSIPTLVLALECLEEARNVDAQIREQLNLLLEQGLEDQDSARQHIAAEAFLIRRLRNMAFVEDNRVLDTSFITCAEYQLFLDEMYTLGKYYQPDQWQEKRFTSGQARQPVVGVRPSDAQAFCTWLNEREAGPWQYRLPTQHDYQNQEGKLNLPAGWNKPIGAWQDDEQGWLWIEHPTQQIPSPPVSEQSLSPLNLDLQRITGNIDIHDLDLASIRSEISNLADILAITSNSIDNFAPSIRSEISNLADILAITSNLARALTNTNFIALTFIKDSELADGLARARDSMSALVHSSIFVHTRDLASASALASSLASTLTGGTLVNNLKGARALASTLAGDLDKIINRAYTDAITFTHTNAKGTAIIIMIADDSDLARVSADALSLASALTEVSIDINTFIRPYNQLDRTQLLVLAQIIALLSTFLEYMSATLQHLRADTLLEFSRVTSSSLKRFFSSDRKTVMHPEIEQIAMRGLEIHSRLSRLNKRLTGEEIACEGILIVGKRKGSLIPSNDADSRP